MQSGEGRGGVEGGECSFKCLEKAKDYSTARDDAHGPHASFIVGFSLKLDLFFLLCHHEDGRTLLL